MKASDSGSQISVCQTRSLCLAETFPSSSSRGSRRSSPSLHNELRHAFSVVLRSARKLPAEQKVVNIGLSLSRASLFFANANAQNVIEVVK